MDDTERLKEIFAQALRRKTAAERDSYLAEACQGDIELRHQVETLLQAHEKAGDFLAQTMKLPMVEFESERLGSMIGRYKLLEKIGEGGFGVVYMAEQQEPVQRKVALKIIKAGMDTREVIARFEAERQALALMDHPNIAKVLDAGTTEAKRPYFVMELVRGIPITDYCDEKNLSTTERLQLFIKVCQAVQHAHQKAVIHRDLKPSNILVTLHDGEPIPKVIDFGVAKALGQKLTEKTLFTSLRQMIGTPAYMSPEQAEMSGLDIDTRSDVYSLGVLLYELLTGETPFDKEVLAKAALDDFRRMIRETEPPKPSTRLRTLGGKITQVAKHRQIQPERLSRLVQGDLDWIAMKCLEKDRARRYETANDLATDVSRFLNCEPTTAAAPSTFYRVRKFARRHRSALITGALFLVMLLGGTIVSLWQAVRAMNAESKSAFEARYSDQIAGFLEHILESARPSAALGHDTTWLRDVLDQAAAQMEKDLKDEPGLRAAFEQHIGRVYWELGQNRRAEAMFRASLAIEAKFRVPRHLNLAVSLLGLSQVLVEQGRHQEAESYMRRALNLCQKAQPGHDRELADALSVLGVILFKSKPQEADQLLRQALTIRMKMYGETNVDVAESQRNLAVTSKMLGHLTEAEELQSRALATQRQLLGPKHPKIASSLNNLAVILLAQRKLSEAESLENQSLAMNQELLGREHPDVADNLANLGAIRFRQGRLREAQTLLEQALRMQEKLLGTQLPVVAETINTLASILMTEGCLQEAEGLLERALDIEGHEPGPPSPEYANSLIGLGTVLIYESRSAEAEAVLRKSLVVLTTSLGEQKAKSEVLNELGAALHLQGRLAEAEQNFDESLTASRQILGEEHCAVADTLDNLASVLEAEHKLVEAERAFDRALAMRRKIFGNLSFEVAESTWRLARVLVAESKPVEARELLTQAVSGLHRLATSEYSRIGDILDECGLLLSELGEYAGAEMLLKDAVFARKSRFGNADPSVADSLATLAQVLKNRGNLEPAEAACREALAIRRHCWGDKHESVAGNLNDLGTIMEEKHQLDQAAELYRQSVEMFRELSPDKPSDFEGPLLNLANVTFEMGDAATAEALYRQGLATRKEPLDEDLMAASFLDGLAKVLVFQHVLKDQERLIRQALAIRTRVLGEAHPYTVATLNNLNFFFSQYSKDSDYMRTRTELTLARLGLTASWRQKLGLDESIEVITRAITSGKFVPDEPDETLSTCLGARAFLFGQHGRWRAAIGDLAQARQIVPTFLPAFGLGPMLIEAVDLEGYTNFSRSVWLKFGSTTDPNTAAEAAIGMLLRPRTMTTLSTASDLADLAVERGTNDARIALFELAKALADYRQGRFSTAADWARKAQLSDSIPETQVAAAAVLAMSQWQLQQADQALRTLSDAITLSQTRLPAFESGDLGGNWSEWLIARILMREAGSLINAEAKPQKRI
jgi:serine/threonine protein kinase/tetratricopeptide (TPR) repeat protein